jgi:hypothetical protein
MGCGALGGAVLSILSLERFSIGRVGFVFEVQGLLRRTLHRL